MSDPKPIDPELVAWLKAKAERLERLYPQLNEAGLKPTFVAFDEMKGEQK